MEEISQELRIVIGHFFEVRDAPALVNRISVKAAANLIVNTSERHTLKRSLRDVKQIFIARGLIALQQQVNGAGVREFRRVAEAAVRLIELAQRRFNHRIDHACIKCAASAVKNFRFGDGLFERLRGSIHFGAAGFEGLRNRREDAFHSRPSAGIVGRKIGAAEKRLSIRREERGEGPAALAGNRADRGLIPGVDVGAFVAIHFYGNVEPVDDRGDFGILVAFAVDHVAPVAPHRADIEQNRFGFGARLLKSLFAPLVPVDGLMRR